MSNQGQINEQVVEQTTTESNTEVKKSRGGRTKQYFYERKAITTLIPKSSYDKLMETFKSPTEAINFLINEWVNKQG